jgi:hypothetical protein
MPAQEPPRAIVERPLARAALGVVLLAMMLSVVVFITLRPAPRSIIARRPGGLQVMATPFARIESITEVASGRRVTLERDATTPRLVSPLVPGTYRVVLTCPSLERTVSRDISVGAGPPVLLSQSFLEPAALVELLR